MGLLPTLSRAPDGLLLWRPRSLAMRRDVDGHMRPGQVGLELRPGNCGLQWVWLGPGKACPPAQPT